MITIVAIFVISIFAGYGMYVRGGSRAGNPNQHRDYPVAKINGHEIMRSQIESELSNLSDQAGAKATTSQDLAELRSAVLENMAIMQEMQKEIANRHIKVAKDEVDKVLAQIEDQFPTKEAFQQYLERNQITPDKIRKDVEAQIAQQKLIDQVTQGALVTSSEVRSFYDSTQTLLFKRPEGYLINIASFSSRSQAEAARSKLRSGETWDHMLSTFSNSIVQATPFAKPTFIPSSKLPQELNFLKTLPNGSVSNPILISSQDCVLVLKREKTPERILPFEEASADVSNMLLSQKKRTLQMRFIQGLKERAKIEILDPTIFAKPVSSDKATPKSN